MKKITAILLTVLMLTAALPFASFAAYENTYTNTGNQIEDLIGVATTQVGYKEGNSSSQLGGTTAGSGNYTKYGQWYGINPGAWCAMFVSWCANQAGISSSIIPKHASCDVGMNWFKNNGLWKTSAYFGGSYTPKRGDIIYFGDNPNNLNDSTHVGIVTGVSGSTVYTIEGNKSNKCQTYSYSLSSSYIFGYGTPKYTGTGSTTPSTNLGVYIVTASSLNMRAQPNSSSTILAVLSNGTAVTISQISGNWGYTTYGTKSGWLSLSYLLAQNNIKYAVSNEGIDLIKGFEGYSQYKYWDVSQWSIGYGTGCGEDDYPNGITEAEADALLRSAVLKYELYLNTFLSDNNITLNQNQYDALVSFTYNLGNIWASKSFTLKTYLINGVSNYTSAQITSAFKEHNTAGGQVLDGLTARREAEAAYFLSGGSSTTPTTGTVYRVTATSLTMREGPGTSYTAIGYLSNGTQVTITQTSGHWGYTTYNNKSGWISLNYCELVSSGTKEYTLTFDPNGGTMVGQTEYGINYGDYYKDIFTSGLPVATRSGYELGSWYNERYGYTLSLADSEFYAVRENNTFKAQWVSLASYTITYNANGGSGAPSNQTKTAGVAITLSTVVPTRSGYTFIGWAKSSGATTAKYQPGDTYSTDANLTLYAVWQQDAEPTYTLTFDPNGGTMVSPATYSIHYGDYYADVFPNGLPAAEREGYTLTGWYNEKYDYTLSLAASEFFAVRENITVKAQWQQNVHTHTWVLNSTTAATCTATGTRYYTCSGCGQTKTETIAALGHNYTSSVTAATCTERGFTTHTCTRCGTGYVDTYTNALGHNWGAWTVVTAAQPGVAGLEKRACERCSAEETREIAALPVENDDEVVYAIEDYDFIIYNATGINAIRFASGDLSSSGEIRNAPDCVSLSASLIAANTSNGVFTYTMKDGGHYSFWIRYDDGTANGKSYVLRNLDFTNISQRVINTGKNLDVTVENLYGVRDYFIARGTQNAYADCNNQTNKIVRIMPTDDPAKVASSTTYFLTGAKSFTYRMGLDKISADGNYTICIRYTDANRANTILHFTKELPEPTLEVVGLQVKIGNLDDIKNIRRAKGTYTTPGEVKRGTDARVYTASVIKNSDPYTLQFVEEGTYTISIEYNGGYSEVHTVTIQKLTPTVTQSGRTLTFSGLDNLYNIRYAKGNFTTAAQIKAAAGAVAIKSSAIDANGRINVTLTAGTYTFAVQYTDNSVTILHYTIS